MDTKKKLTSASGIPYSEHENSKTVGQLGPILVEYFILYNLIAIRGINSPKRDEILNRQLCLWIRADLTLGMAIAKGLGIRIEYWMQQH